MSFPEMGTKLELGDERVWEKVDGGYRGLTSAFAATRL